MPPGPREMFFEGSEKKAEIVVDRTKTGSLREVDRDIWSKMVRLCGGDIISSISGTRCTAFLLSESSLFVWDDTFLIITCGRTRLVEGLVFFLDRFKDIRLLIFQRKNEYYSDLQESSFEEDVVQLKRKTGGRALRFGHRYGHHNSLFYASKNFSLPANDRTTELLMYSIRDDVARLLRSPSADHIRKVTGLGDYLHDFDFDDHVFGPYGYSLNAIRDDRYMAIHITPQEGSSYVSFETNLSLRGRYEGLLEKMIHVFKPSSFDLVDFNGANSVKSENFVKANHFREQIDSGHLVNFRHFVSLNNETLRPVYL